MFDDIPQCILERMKATIWEKFFISLQLLLQGSGGTERERRECQRAVVATRGHHVRRSDDPEVFMIVRAAIRIDYAGIRIIAHTAAATGMIVIMKQQYFQ